MPRPASEEKKLDWKNLIEQQGRAVFRLKIRTNLRSSILGALTPKSL